jgi:hypothetical protein
MALIGCASNKAVSQNDIIGLKAENTPEGIVLTFDHIPLEATRLFVHFLGEGENAIPVFADIRGTLLDQVKETGILVCPFVQNGRYYNIGVSVDVWDEDDPQNFVNVGIIAGNGIHTLNEIALELNDSRIGVTLSEEPIFSSDVQHASPKFRYSVTVKVDSYNSIGYGQLKDELEWEFLSGMLDDYKKDNINISGDFAAYVTAYCNINYNNILWTVGVANSKEFTVSL